MYERAPTLLRIELYYAETHFRVNEIHLLT